MLGVEIANLSNQIWREKKKDKLSRAFEIARALNHERKSQ